MKKQRGGTSSRLFRIREGLSPRGPSSDMNEGSMPLFEELARGEGSWMGPFSASKHAGLLNRLRAAETFHL